MKIGLFDHLERSDRPLAIEYDERLTFAVAAEAAGFYCLHVAEHHGTPLNMVPVPGVYLGAVARATTRMRLCPMVYLLPLYSPLRLIEEICMLDHLSRGRLDIGQARSQNMQGWSARRQGARSRTKDPPNGPGSIEWRWRRSREVLWMRGLTSIAGKDTSA